MTTSRTTTTTTTIMLALCSCVIALPLSAAPAVYDQKQTGDLNVQIELKNVHVVALLDSEILEDYTDYDYFYDYADFTIKPSERPTSSSTSAGSTEEESDVAQTVESALSENPTASSASPPVNSTSNSIDQETPSVDPSLNGTVNSTSNTDTKNQPSEENGPELIDSALSTTLAFSTPPVSTPKPYVQALRSRRRCKTGYIPTGNGRCRRTNRRWLSLLP
ncbi:PREDICTED: uncharacterized protein LOC106746321 [Dinoponera quadriceps]|uniref:Uncharacterized protein LOC106746321 n=1 Tax=Dinoponera quadriceps TaxID=609295 RepID=A0A6P3XJZ8_DINQU|nr:PREDICTED: uncharacterized protein LOC106746321 [Dinoponera quadriceps]